MLSAKLGSTWSGSDQTWATLANPSQYRPAWGQDLAEVSQVRKNKHSPDIFRYPLGTHFSFQICQEGFRGFRDRMSIRVLNPFCAFVSSQSRAMHGRTGGVGCVAQVVGPPLRQGVQPSGPPTAAHGPAALPSVSPRARSRGSGAGGATTVRAGPRPSSREIPALPAGILLASTHVGSGDLPHAYSV